MEVSAGTAASKIMQGVQGARTPMIQRGLGEQNSKFLGSWRSIGQKAEAVIVCVGHVVIYQACCVKCLGTREHAHVSDGLR